MIPLYTPDQLSAFWSAVEAIATVVAGTVAIVTLLALRSDSRERSRPVMSADLLPEVLTYGTSQLVVENIGLGVAKNVRVTFDPELPKYEGSEADGKITPYLQRRYSQVIPTIGPGRKLSNTYAYGSRDENMGFPNAENVPVDFTIRFDYLDSKGRSYSDQYSLTLQTLMNQTTSDPSSTSEAGMAKRTIRALEAIARGVGRK